VSSEVLFVRQGANVNEQSLSRVNSLGELLDQVQAFEGKMQTLLVPLSMLCWLLLGKDRQRLFSSMEHLVYHISIPYIYSVELPGGYLSAFLSCTVVPAGFGLFIRLQ